MASRLPAGTRIVATDRNQPMLDHAAVSIPNDGRIDWHKADALSLPFEDGAFDAVICQFGVMFFPDKVEGFTEARRVLKPGGTFIFNVWDRISENAFATVVFEAMSEMFPADPPSSMARTPHGYHDLDLIRADLTAAGFGTMKPEACEQTSVAATPATPPLPFARGPRSGPKSRRGMPLVFGGSNPNCRQCVRSAIWKRPDEGSPQGVCGLRRALTALAHGAVRAG